MQPILQEDTLLPLDPLLSRFIVVTTDLDV